MDQVKVQTIRSEGELKQALAEAAAAAQAREPDAVATVVLCVGSTTCRPCHKFEPTYYDMAARHPAARFLRVNADAGPASLDLVANALRVESTPQFIFYSRGEEAARVQGGNAARFEEALQLALRRSREGAPAAGAGAADNAAQDVAHAAGAPEVGSVAFGGIAAAQHQQQVVEAPQLSAAGSSSAGAPPPPAAAPRAVGAVQQQHAAAAAAGSGGRGGHSN